VGGGLGGGGGGGRGGGESEREKGGDEEGGGTNGKNNTASLRLSFAPKLQVGIKKGDASLPKLPQQSGTSFSIGHPSANKEAGVEKGGGKINSCEEPGTAPLSPENPDGGT